MGQIEVYEWLKKQRLLGNEDYFSSQEVVKALKQEGLSPGALGGVRGDLIKLELSGYLDIQMSGRLYDWRRTFRIKEKYAIKR